MRANAGSDPLSERPWAEIREWAPFNAGGVDDFEPAGWGARGRTATFIFIKTQPDQQQVLSLDSYQCVSDGCSAVWWRGYSSLHGQHVWALIATVSVLGFTPVTRSRYVVESRIICSTSCGQA